MHCLATDIFDTSAKCIFTYMLLQTCMLWSAFNVYGLLRPRLISALLHFNTAPWFSGDTRVYNIHIHQRIVTNKFVPEISPFSSSSITSLIVALVSKSGAQWRIVRRKERRIRTMLKPYTKKTEPNCYQLRKWYITIPSIIFGCKRLSDLYNYSYLQFTNFN